MTVTVRFGAGLAAGRRSVELAGGATVADLLAALAAELGPAEALASVAVAVNGEVVGREHVLRDGEAVALIRPVAGG